MKDNTLNLTCEDQLQIAVKFMACEYAIDGLLRHLPAPECKEQEHAVNWAKDTLGWLKECRESAGLPYDYKSITDLSVVFNDENQNHNQN